MDSKKDIENIAFTILKDSKSLGKFPTPVDNILKYSELTVDKSVDLSKEDPSFFTKNWHTFKKALRKVRGVIDIRQKKVYLDLSTNINKQRFVKLHETGHNVLLWQKKTFEFIDDDKTLSLDFKETFEKEASYFASSTLFQLDRFEEEAEKLPLSLESPMLLAKKFGSSNHAAMRRYVEYSKKQCALLVFENYNSLTKTAILRNYFQSQKFTIAFGNLLWPDMFDRTYPFIFDLSIGKRLNTLGTFRYSFENIILQFSYHYFNNTYNYFVFLFPISEYNKSRVQIYTTI